MADFNGILGHLAIANLAVILVEFVVQIYRVHLGSKGLCVCFNFCNALAVSNVESALFRASFGLEAHDLPAVNSA